MSFGTAPNRGTEFINKTWSMVCAEHPEIGWDDSGTLIVVKNAERLASVVLPQYFRHNQYASWVRALNAHDFKKSGTDRWQHPYFLRDRSDLLPQIRRKAAPTRNAGGRPSEAGPSTAIVRVAKRPFDQGHSEGGSASPDAINDERTKCVPPLRPLPASCASHRRRPPHAPLPPVRSRRASHRRASFSRLS